MMRNLLAIAWVLTSVTLAAPPAKAAPPQHGDAPNGYYPAGFMGDTWTGVVSVIDPDKREITLTATTKKGTETFVAYVPEHFINGGSGPEVKMSDFGIGQKLRVYYIPKNPKVNGQKVKRNEIIRIESVPQA